MTPTLYRSYRYCDRLARRQAANFYPAFRLLPRDQRLSMCALYAFMRVADDLSDEPGEPAAKRESLEKWRHRLDAALAGRLHEPAVLEQQTRRMLADPRSQALTTNFAGQWLALRRLREVNPTS